MYFAKPLKALTILAVCLFFTQIGANAKMDVMKIDAQKNAVDHNNRGVIHMQDRYYAAAIKEFQMAVLLDPETQASSVYYANLANCYMKIGYPALAQDTLQRAIRLNPMNLSNYQDLAVAFKKQKILDQKLRFYQKEVNKNPLNQIMIGLILIEQGKQDAGLAKLQEFVYTEPDLIISGGVKKYIEERTDSKI